MLRFPTHDTKTLTLADGETLTVKARLTHGEVMAMFQRMYEQRDGQNVVSPVSGDAVIVAYLIEWSARDEHGQPVPLRGLSADEVQDRLNALDHDSVLEIRNAINQHADAMRAEADTLKKTAGGVNVSAPI